MAKIIALKCSYLLLISLLLVIFAKSSEAYSVVDFGARPDGQTDSTQAFQEAWAMACGSVRPATLDVPLGSFVLQPTRFSGLCKSNVTLRIKGTIVGPSDFRVMARSNVWLTFYNVKGLNIEGGTLDARGYSFWSCRKQNGYCFKGAQSISFVSCNNVVVRGLKSINSQKSHMSLMNCNNVALSYLNFRAPSGSPNTDGINIQHSNTILIDESVIGTGDDCVAIGPGTKNMIINKITCGPGHGISIGSMGNTLEEAGVENIEVSNIVFHRTTYGARIKSWPRPSNSYVRNITYQNLVMRNVYFPILIDQIYCPNNQCPQQNSGVKIRDVSYKNVKGTSRLKEAMTFTCSPSNPCTGIKLEDIRLTYGSAPAISSCSYVRGTTRGQVIPKSCF